MTIQRKNRLLIRFLSSKPSVSKQVTHVTVSEAADQEDLVHPETMFPAVLRMLKVRWYYMDRLVVPDTSAAEDLAAAWGNTHPSPR